MAPLPPTRLVLRSATLGACLAQEHARLVLCSATALVSLPLQTHRDEQASKLLLARKQVLMLAREVLLIPGYSRIARCTVPTAAVPFSLLLHHRRNDKNKTNKNDFENIILR